MSMGLIVEKHISYKNRCSDISYSVGVASIFYVHKVQPKKG